MADPKNATQQPKDKRYNIEGVISGLQVSPMQNKPGDRAMFKLIREGKPAIRCAAFGDKAQKLLAGFSEGQKVRLFGFFKDNSFTGENGETVRMQEFSVLWSGAPKAAQQADKTAQKTKAA